MTSVAIVTGASGGLGSALVAELLRSNRTVIAAVRDPAAAGHLKDLPGAEKLQVIRCNVASEPERRNLIDAARVAGNIELLINNAGTAMGDALETQSMADIRTVFDVNVFGAIELAKLCLPDLKKNAGHLINISSVVGQVPLPYLGAYSASKHALGAFTIALSLEMLGSPVKFILAECGPLRSKLCADAIVDASEPEYGETQGSVKRGVKRLGTRYAVPVERAASRIIGAISSQKNFQRLTIGSFAGWMLFWNRILPSFVFQRLLARRYQVRLSRT